MTGNILDFIRKQLNVLLFSIFGAWFFYGANNASNLYNEFDNLFLIAMPSAWYSIDGFGIQQI